MDFLNLRPPNGLPGWANQIFDKRLSLKGYNGDVLHAREPIEDTFEYRFIDVFSTCCPLIFTLSFLPSGWMSVSEARWFLDTGCLPKKMLEYARKNPIDLFSYQNKTKDPPLFPKISSEDVFLQFKKEVEGLISLSDCEEEEQENQKTIIENLFVFSEDFRTKNRQIFDVSFAEVLLICMELMAKIFSKRIAFDLDQCKIEENKHLKSFFEELDQSQKEAEDKLKVLEENRKIQREQVVLSQSRGLSL